MRARDLTSTVLAAATVWLCTALAGMAGAEAAESGFSSYVTPFPPSDRYRLYLFGDSLAAGLAQPLAADLAPQGLEIINKTAPGFGLARGDGNDWDKSIEAMPQTEIFQIAVIQFGVDDRVAMRSANKRLDLGSPAWLQEYERRVDAMLKALHGRNVAVYWLGLPIMRTPGAIAAAQTVNRIFAERVRLSGAKFIDSWDGFVDADGGYADQGPDMTGIVKLLRLADGIHMTLPGYQKLANFVEREIFRDLAVALRERDVPLAGDEAEQQNVRDESLPRRVAAGGPAGGKPVPAGKSAKDVPADDGSVVVAAAGDGAPTPIPIIRPVIPGAAVVEILSSRTSKQSELGQTMPTDLMGGFTVMSSIATSLDAKRGLSKQRPLTENLFYKLLIRGDALPVKPGRVDDFSWPRAKAAPATTSPPDPNG